MTTGAQGPTGGISSGQQSLLTSVSQAVADERVLAAFRQVDRRSFLPPEVRAQAYIDEALPIGHGQTASQPRMIAIMLAALELTGTEKVLEIGTGSGYQTMLLSLLASQVHSVEVVPSFAAAAGRTLESAGIDNVSLHIATTGLGWPQEAPYDAIVVSAAAPRLPQSLIDQLAPGGRIVIPVGDRNLQDLIIAQARPEGLTIARRGACRFVPLVGEDGWPASSS